MDDRVGLGSVAVPFDVIDGRPIGRMTPVEEVLSAGLDSLEGDGED